MRQHNNNNSSNNNNNINHHHHGIPSFFSSFVFSLECDFPATAAFSFVVVVVVVVVGATVVDVVDASPPPFTLVGSSSFPTLIDTPPACSF